MVNVGLTVDNAPVTCTLNITDKKRINEYGFINYGWLQMVNVGLTVDNAPVTCTLNITDKKRINEPGCLQLRSDSLSESALPSSIPGG